MTNEELIKKTAEELLKKMAFDKAMIEIKKSEEPSILTVSIYVDDASQLIGQGGSNLSDFQKVLRLLVHKKNPEAASFVVDINGYREKREVFLKELGKEIAEQVIKTKKSVMLQPMSSYERRVIHLELAKNPEVATESIGEEPERRIVIKPHL